MSPRATLHVPCVKLVPYKKKRGKFLVRLRLHDNRVVIVRQIQIAAGAGDLPHRDGPRAQLSRKESEGDTSSLHLRRVCRSNIWALRMRIAQPAMSLVLQAQGI